LITTDPNHDRIFKIIAKAALEVNQPTYVVGGFVRDFYLDRLSDSKLDIDFVTIGSGIVLAEKVAELLNVQKVAFFKQFGTAHLSWKGYDLEFVGARKESYHHESRNPVVEDGTLEDDQKRRDFTINALSWSLNDSDFGTLIDPFGGIQDLKNKVIKTPLDPDITFSDDPLRMMRAIRFASQLNFEIDEPTMASIKRMCHRIDIISIERVVNELNKIILSKVPSRGFKLLFESGLLKRFFPELTDLHGVQDINGIRHKDNFWHTLQVLDNVAESSDNLWLRWAAILHDIAKPPTQRFHPEIGWTFHGHETLGASWTKKIFKRFNLPLDERLKYVQKLVRLHLRPIALVNEEVTDSAIRRLLFEAGEEIDDLMTLCRADITSKNENKVKRYLNNFEFVAKRLKEVEEKDKLRNWQPPVRGDEIMELLGLTAGPDVGKIKSAIENAILDGIIENDKDQALAFMYRIKEEILPTNPDKSAKKEQ
jgi:poly(A) polymerase